MSDTSFIVYDPCDGDNPTIALRADSITIGYLWEPATFRLNGIDEGNPTLIRATFSCDSGDQEFTLKVTLLEESNGLSRWDWAWDACGWAEDRSWLMVPTANAHRFPTIEHPCRESKELEYEFLDVPF
jgi:hypothetical protein